MTEPRDLQPNEPLDDLVDFAAPYALDAVDDTERHAIETAVERASAPVRERFDDAVREAREVMAAQSDATALAPPPELYDRIIAELTAPADENVVALDARRKQRNRLLGVAAAAAVVVAIGVGVVTIGTHGGDQPPTPTPGVSDVFAADDVRTAVAPIDGGGTATLVYSRTADAAVLVMNDVPPPPTGSAYQMWLLGSTHDPVSAGVMDTDAVAPSTTAFLQDLDQSTSLAFTLEPSGGSETPSGEPFAAFTLE
ncbi:anti-sigma factor [Rhodococcus triatomae]|uniref:Regulator of SigK n=1 Tax=Rhodococcus triatomae TaxID=300028 RepID=A0A1G8QGI9_9NOCA|nr:anti-sigma factor [Rhodococcus triatomae]QNG20685.1 anti-sigma factor [Rhodococcus triatomae]QNG23397.1 anti-sigma factor [Rhodococcus triatomae]SDJ03545.1 Anti-sigma-K factor RskA [Rhodococcus triatomae]